MMFIVNDAEVILAGTLRVVEFLLKSSSVMMLSNNGMGIVYYHLPLAVSFIKLIIS